jgi:hypothetical protein
LTSCADTDPRRRPGTPRGPTRHSGSSLTPDVRLAQQRLERAHLREEVCATTLELEDQVRPGGAGVLEPAGGGDGVQAPAVPPVATRGPPGRGGQELEGGQHGRPRVAWRAADRPQPLGHLRRRASPQGPQAPVARRAVEPDEALVGQESRAPARQLALRRPGLRRAGRAGRREDDGSEEDGGKAAVRACAHGRVARSGRGDHGPPRSHARREARVSPR